MSLSTYYLEYGCHVAWLHRRHHCRRVYTPTSNTTSHDNHEKINSWVSFSFLQYMSMGLRLASLWAAGALPLLHTNAVVPVLGSISAALLRPVFVPPWGELGDLGKERGPVSRTVAGNWAYSSTKHALNLLFWFWSSWLVFPIVYYDLISCSCSLEMEKKMRAHTLERPGLSLTNFPGNQTLWVANSMLKWQQ